MPKPMKRTTILRDADSVSDFSLLGLRNFRRRDPVRRSTPTSQPRDPIPGKGHNAHQ